MREPAAGGEGVARLELLVRSRLSCANTESTRKTTRTALRKLAKFGRGAAYGRKLFLRPRLIGDVEVACHNEWTLMLWAEHMLLTPSRKTGRPLAVATVSAYVSLAKTELSAQLGFELVGTSERRLRRIFKAMRRAEPVRSRRKRRGLRGRHLRKAFSIEKPWVPAVGGAGATDASGRDVVAAEYRQRIAEWAAVATGREAVARGSELCTGNAPGPTRADLTFEHDRHGETATLWLRPLKKRGREEATKVPIVFAKFDGGGSDTYAALKRMVDADPVPVSRRAKTPLFRNANGTGMALAHYRKVVRRIAAALGFDPKHFGTHSPRIGGATDIGDESPLMLQAKGRWAGDLGKIYSRLTRRGLVRASRAMQHRGSRDMEEIHAAFSQPA